LRRTGQPSDVIPSSGTLVTTNIERILAVFSESPSLSQSLMTSAHPQQSTTTFYISSLEVTALQLLLTTAKAESAASACRRPCGCLAAAAATQALGGWIFSFTASSWLVVARTHSAVCRQAPPRFNFSKESLEST
jgi:hypothetical protein